MRLQPEPQLSTNQTPDEAVLPAPAVVPVTTWRVSCDGDEARALGHPRVWMAISPASGFVDCGYCDTRFVIDRAHASEH